MTLKAVNFFPSCQPVGDLLKPFFLSFFISMKLKKFQMFLPIKSLPPQVFGQSLFLFVLGSYFDVSGLM